MPTNSAPKFKYNDLRQRLRAGMDAMISPGQPVTTEPPAAAVVDPSSAKAFTDPTNLGARVTALPADAPAAATAVAPAPSNRDIANQVYANRRAFEENAVRGGIGGTSDAIRTTGANSDYSKRLAASDQAARDRTAAFNVARANQNEGLNPFASHLLAQSQMNPGASTGHALNDAFLALTLPAPSFEALKNSQTEMAKTGLLVSPEYHRQAMQRAIAGNPNLPPQALGTLMRDSQGAGAPIVQTGGAVSAMPDTTFLPDGPEKQHAIINHDISIGKLSDDVKAHLDGIYGGTNLTGGTLGRWIPNGMRTNDRGYFERFRDAVRQSHPEMPEAADKIAENYWRAHFGSTGY